MGVPEWISQARLGVDFKSPCRFGSLNRFEVVIPLANGLQTGNTDRLLNNLYGLTNPRETHITA